jgi:glycosyltransferase involved in cell wall biosynthesis
MRVLACNSAYGDGGIGQHFAQLVEESRATNQLRAYYSPTPKAGDRPGRRVTRPRWHGWLLRYTPARWTPKWRGYLNSELFDRSMARQLDTRAERFMGFVGNSLHTFRRAAALGYETLELVAANSHVENVQRLHERAERELGIRDSWLHEREVRKTKQEYAMADVIYVHSDYTRDSFLAAGMPPDKLERTVLCVDPRFEPPADRPDDGMFRVVYVGRLDATKGIPLLLRAFAELPVSPKALTLVGGWSSRAMRRYMENWLARDLDITVAPGDPLPALQQADVFVHPTYEDGFGYAPMEAMACGVPVIATEDTGMKEYIRPGENGFVVPTGNREAIRERLEWIADTPMATTQSLLPNVETPAAG